MKTLKSKIHTGPRGGKFVLVGGSRKYLNETELAASLNAPRQQKALPRALLTGASTVVPVVQGRSTKVTVLENEAAEIVGDVLKHAKVVGLKSRASKIIVVNATRVSGRRFEFRRPTPREQKALDWLGSNIRWILDFVAETPGAAFTAVTSDRRKHTLAFSAGAFQFESIVA